jgi:hypothetical protein
MRKKWLAVLILPCLLVSAPAARAGEKAAEAPTIVVRFESLNALLQNLNLVVRLVGQEEAANQIEGLVKSKIGKQGLEGIDPSRPFGAYVRFGKAIDEINGAILIPMADPETFLKLLDNLNINVTKDKDDIYTHKTNKNFNLYFRFAHKCLYITSVNTESIQNKNLLEPAKALAVPGNAMVSLVARVDQIPSEAKQLALAQLEESLLAAQKKGDPKETKAQQEFRIALLREANRFGSSLIRETSELRFDLNVSDKTKELTVNFSVTGKPGSDLAKMIQAAGTLQSPLGGVAPKNAAFRGALHMLLPDALNKALGDVIDEVVEKSLEGIQNEQKRKQAETLFKAMLPTVKAGEIQFAAAVLGPQEKHFTVVTAVKLKDGEKLGRTVRDLIKDALGDVPPNLRAKIQLDFDSAGDIKIHKLEIPNEAKIDPMVARIAGDSTLYLAFRDDALFLAMGQESIAILKAVLASKDAAASMPLVFDFDLARMAPLMSQTAEQKTLASKLFADGNNGRLRLVISGGESLSARLQIQLNVIEFLVKMKNDKGQ